MMINRSAIPYASEDDKSFDAYFQYILMRFYSIFRVFNGTFADVMERERRSGLRHRLALLLSFYLPRVQVKMPVILPFLDTVSVVPLERTAYLTIQYLVSSLAAHFPGVRVALIAHSNKLVYSAAPRHLTPALLTLATDPAYLSFAHHNATLQPPDVPDLPYKVKRDKAPWFDVDRHTCPPLRAWPVATLPSDGFVHGGPALEADTVLPRLWLHARPPRSRLAVDVLGSVPLDGDAEGEGVDAAALEDMGVSGVAPVVCEGDAAMVAFVQRGVTVLLSMRVGQLSAPQLTPAPTDLSSGEVFLGTGSVLNMSGARVGTDVALMKQIGLFLSTNMSKVADILQANNVPEKKIPNVGWVSINLEDRCVRSSLGGGVSEAVARVVNTACIELRDAHERSHRDKYVLNSGLGSAVSAYLRNKEAVLAARKERERVEKEAREEQERERRRQLKEEKERVSQLKREQREKEREEREKARILAGEGSE